MMYVAITKIGNTYYMYISKDKFIYLVKYPFCRALLNKKLSKRIINEIVSNSSKIKNNRYSIDITINSVGEFTKYLDHQLFWESEKVIEAYKL